MVWNGCRARWESENCSTMHYCSNRLFRWLFPMPPRCCWASVLLARVKLFRGLNLPRQEHAALSAIGLSHMGLSVARHAVKPIHWLPVGAGGLGGLSRSVGSSTTLSPWVEGVEKTPLCWRRTPKTSPLAPSSSLSHLKNQIHPSFRFPSSRDILFPALPCY